MRCMLKVSMPTEIANQRVADGSLRKTIESILSEINPEAAYFAEDRGIRTGYIFCNVKEESDIVAIAEPWFLAFHAQVEFHPAMTLADLKKAAPSFEKTVKKYSHLPKAA